MSLIQRIVAAIKEAEANGKRVRAVEVRGDDFEELQRIAEAFMVPGSTLSQHPRIFDRDVFVNDGLGREVRVLEGV